MQEKRLVDALSHALACVAQDNFSEGIKKYKEIISFVTIQSALDHSSPAYDEALFRAYVGLGQALRLSKNYLEAITAFNTALRISEKYPESPNDQLVINPLKCKLFQYRAESKYNLFCKKVLEQGLLLPNDQPFGEDREYERTKLKDIYQDLTTALLFFNKLPDNSSVKTLETRLKIYSIRSGVTASLGLYADAIKDYDMAIMLSDSENPNLFQLCRGRAVAKTAVGDDEGAAEDYGAYDNAKSESRRQLEMAKQKGIARLSFFHHHDDPDSLDKKTHIMHESEVPRMA